MNEYEAVLPVPVATIEPALDKRVQENWPVPPEIVDEKVTVRPKSMLEEDGCKVMDGAGSTVTVEAAEKEN